MKDHNTNQARPSINSQLADIVAGFKAVLQECGASDASAIEFTLIDQNVEKAGARLLPQGCKHKCWYAPATTSTQCGIVCSL
jgi:hypothetical protein